MRIAIVAESFLPRVNGVTNSVRQVVSRLRAGQHECLIVAPDTCADSDVDGVPVARVRSVQLPGVPDVDVAFGRVAPISSILTGFQADVVHLASPFILGARAQAAAREMNVPTVAVFQTDVAGYARHYRLGPLTGIADGIIRQIHRSATVTLAPSQAAARYLRDLGVPRIRTWGRGVDTGLFARSARCASLHDALGGGRPLVGYVGRLAPEKAVHSLATLADRRDLQLVIIGDGPEKSSLARLMPEAIFLGRLAGPDLASAMATLDVLVAPGELETFCQVIQEAMASGVPVVAPEVGGPVDLIESDEDGLLYRPGDWSEMAQCVDRLLQDDGLRERVVANGQRRVARRSWDALTDELLGHYAHAQIVNRRAATTLLPEAA